jgi:hypothetical protein
LVWEVRVYKDASKDATLQCIFISEHNESVWGWQGGFGFVWLKSQTHHWLNCLLCRLFRLFSFLSFHFSLLLLFQIFWLFLLIDFGNLRLQILVSHEQTTIVGISVHGWHKSTKELMSLQNWELWLPSYGAQENEM